MIGGVPLNMGATLRSARSALCARRRRVRLRVLRQKSKFLHYMPQVAILTSVELDHVDIFADLEHIKQAFRDSSI